MSRPGPRNGFSHMHAFAQHPTRPNHHACVHCGLAIPNSALAYALAHGATKVEPLSVRCPTCLGSGEYRSGLHLIACPQCCGEGLVVPTGGARGECDDDTQRATGLGREAWVYKPNGGGPCKAL